LQPFVGSVQEDAAQGKKKRYADETSRQDKDLPTFDIWIPGYGHDKVVQPQLRKQLNVGVNKCDATYYENGDRESFDTLLGEFVHILVIFVLWYR
jgi:hypothetical protein